jgi:hypothetical protein
MPIFLLIFFCNSLGILAVVSGASMMLIGLFMIFKGRRSKPKSSPEIEKPNVVTITYPLSPDELFQVAEKEKAMEEQARAADASWDLDCGAEAESVAEKYGYPSVSAMNDTIQQHIKK